MLSNAFRYNAGLIRANGVPIDVSGDTGTLLDRHGNPIRTLKRLDAIHRTDWQGRQLLYPVARTNALAYSNPVSANGTARWTGNFDFDLSEEYIGPNQYATLTRLTATSSAPINLHNDGYTTALDADALMEFSIALRAGTVSKASFGLYDYTTASFGVGTDVEFSVDSGPAILAVTPGATHTNLIDVTNLNDAIDSVIRVRGRFPAGSRPTGLLYVNRKTDAAVGQTLLAARAMISRDAVPGQGSFISTDGSVRTVTDYTLGAAGEVTTGEVPVEGAVLDWSGVAIR